MTMFFRFLLLLSLVLPVYAQDMYNCNGSLYESFLDYRYCINDNQYCDVNIVERSFFSKEQSLNFIKRSIEVDRDLVMIEYYYEACDDGNGELYLGIVRSDGAVGSSVIDYVYEEGKWLQLGEQLFLYSDVLGEPFYEIDHNDLIIVDQILVSDGILQCLSRLIKSDFRKNDYEKYKLEVENCYINEK